MLNCCHMLININKINIYKLSVITESYISLYNAPFLSGFRFNRRKLFQHIFKGGYQCTEAVVVKCCVSVMMKGFVLKDQVRPSPLCFLNSSRSAWGSAAKPGS